MMVGCQNLSCGTQIMYFGRVSLSDTAQAKYHNLLSFKEDFLVLFSPACWHGICSYLGNER